MWKVVLISTALTTAALAQELPFNDYPADAPISLQVVHAAVAQSINDPASAQYKKVAFILDDNGFEYVCGLVNWKNSSGGYGDFVPFAAPLNLHRTELINAESALEPYAVGLAPCLVHLGLEKP